MSEKTPAKRGNPSVPSDKQKRWSFAPSSLVLLVGIAVVIGYAAGTRNDQIVATVAPALGFKVETGTLDMSSVQNTFRQLKANFDGKLDEKALTEGASKGLVSAAGDIHTEYFTREEAKEFDQDLTGNIGGGIGAEIGTRNGNATVLGVIKDTPASREGVKIDDVIAKVNDESMEGKSSSDVVSKIRGDIGTTVKLTVVRDGKLVEITLTREEIVSPSVTSEIQGETGVMTVVRFNGDTGEQARQAAQEFKAKGVKNVILDLRDNGGGTLEAAPELAGLWLNDKAVVSERIGGKTVGEQRTGKNAILAGIPTVVLVNENTASASEIVTSALKEYGVVSVVGAKTYGKGTVQTMIDINDGAMLKVTIQRWYTPKGTNLDGKGITPDVKVGLTKEDVDAKRDPQLDAAKAQLAK